MAVSQKQQELLEVLWCQSLREIETFHALFHENDLVALLILKTGENVAAAIVTALLNGISTLSEYPYTPEKWSIETPVKF